MPASFRVLCGLIINLFFVSAVLAETLALNVTAARVDHEARSGRVIVIVTLDETSKRGFGAFTSANIGQKTELQVDGKVVSEPVLREPIIGGSFDIGGGNDWTGEKAAALAHQLSTAAAKVEVETR